MLRMPRPVPEELITFRSLNARLELSGDDQWKYWCLEKGFEGEAKFDQMMEKLQSPCYVINGLLLKFGDSEFQIDSMIMFQHVIHLIDVKNFEGDLYYEEGKLFNHANDKPMKDPLIQLKRCETLFNQLLHSLGYKKMQVEAYLVYINPDFTLLQAPRTYPIVHPTQVNGLMKKLNKIPSQLNSKHEKLANQLISLHLPKSTNAKYPAYSYDIMKKGMMCCQCHSLKTNFRHTKVFCDTCGEEENVHLAILRMVAEIRLLFPDRRITVNLVYEWCNGLVSKKTIRGNLSRNFKTIGHGQWTYYE